MIDLPGPRGSSIPITHTHTLNPSRKAAKNASKHYAAFEGLFGRQGRPKRSIVAHRVPKMTPKWSPKWSQVENGRPSRNMHRRRQIACPPPLGELHFHSFFRVRKISQTHAFKKVRFNKHAPKLPPECPSGDPKRRPKSIKNLNKIASEPPWVPTGDFQWGGTPQKIYRTSTET